MTTHARSGFETSIPVSGGSRRFQIQALDAAGRVLGTSHTFEMTG